MPFNSVHLQALVDLAVEAGNTDFLLTLKQEAKDALEGESKTLSSFGTGAQTFGWVVQYSALDMLSLVMEAIRRYEAIGEDSTGGTAASYAQWNGFPH